MPDYIYHDPNDAAKFVAYRDSLDPSQAGANSTEIAAGQVAGQRLLIRTVPWKHLKIASGLAVEMSQAEKDAVDTAEAAALLSQLRTDAEALIDGLGSNEKALRAILLLTLDELNAIRQWLVSFKAEAAAATNLANFQSRIAGLPNMPDRTASQARTAVKNKIQVGDADQ